MQPIRSWVRFYLVTQLMFQMQCGSRCLVCPAVLCLPKYANRLNDTVSRGGFSELGAPGKYRNGALYICTHLPDHPWGFFLLWCLLLHNGATLNCVIYMILWDPFIYIHLADTFILSCCRLWNSNWFTVRWDRRFNKNKINYKMINLTIEPLNHFVLFLRKGKRNINYYII